MAVKRRLWLLIISCINFLKGEKGPRREMMYDISTRKRVSGAMRNMDYKLIIGPNTEVVDGWFDASNLSNSETRCTGAKECKKVNPDKFLFKISEDETERRPLDLKNLSPDEQKNYDELTQTFKLWHSIRNNPLYPDNITGPWDMYLDADGLPNFWNCSFAPYLPSPHPRKRQPL
eukprot:TRINITY_DN8276_c0_g1_i1.p1 TRINITY_DN8276_c0_g1~~TRINITY_DN8276_c0_g1_i1.p1  ORF type:complete len:175 (+),score=27.29 TRINITY_DN8276_c0_g1_i1:98-622(+)